VRRINVVIPSRAIADGRIISAVANAGAGNTLELEFPPL
jgi:hypothetical protein